MACTWEGSTVHLVTASALLGRRRASVKSWQVPVAFMLHVSGSGEPGVGAGAGCAGLGLCPSV